MHIVLDATKEIIALNSIIRTLNTHDVDVTLHDIKIHYIDPSASTAGLYTLTLHHPDTSDVLRLECELFVMEKTHNPTKDDKECKINILDVTLIDLNTNTTHKTKDITYSLIELSQRSTKTTTDIANIIFDAFSTNWTAN